MWILINPYSPFPFETPYGQFTTTTRFEVIRPDLPPNLTLQRLPTGLLQITAPSFANAFVLESTPSLAPPVSWTPIWTNPANTALLLTDPAAANRRNGFYRALRR